MPITSDFGFPDCTGSIVFHDRNNVEITGQINSSVKGGKMKYYAANPIDRRSSISASAFPFANADQAFESSPNVKEIELGPNNTFKFRICMPNSYYISLGTVLVPPTLFLEYHNGDTTKIITIVLDNPTPFRTLTYAISKEHSSRQNPLFYDGGWKLPVRTQEQILIDSAYPTINKNALNPKIPSNFWGSKPPM